MSGLAEVTLGPEALRDLIERGDGSDRAFVDALVRMDWSRRRDSAERAALRELHAALHGAALRSHAAVRQQIAQGTLRGSALRQLFDAAPPLERDHFVEEILGIAYPPLEEHAPTTDLMSYAPSGYDEIVYAFDQCGLAPRDRFLDLGAGLGKVVMLATLLTGASSVGIEYDQQLCALAERARRDLGLEDVQVRAEDARDLQSVDADVVFMYLPFSGEVLAAVLERLLDPTRYAAQARRPRCLCTGALDLARYPALTVVAPEKSWLSVYAWGAV